MGQPSLRDSWEAEARAWAAWARTPGHDHYHWRYNGPSFLSLVPAPGALTLDVGCGEGRLTRALAERGHRVMGIEPSATLAGLAAEAATVVRGDASALPLPDACADVVVCYMVLQDVDDLDGATAELARVLRSGGTLCLAVVHPIVSSGFFAPDDPNFTFFVGNYLARIRHVLPVERDGLHMTFHSVHRPLETYSRALERAGLCLHAVREPAAPADLVADLPEMARHLRVPNFLHLVATHEGGSGGRAVRRA